jgi:hypothetical protein
MSQCAPEDSEGIKLPPAVRNRRWQRPPREIVEWPLAAIAPRFSILQLGLLSMLMILVFAIPALRAKETGWTLVPRTLPPPAAASAELREALAKTPTPDIKAAIAKVPKSIQEWKVEIAEQAKSAEMVTSLRPSSGQ